MRDEVVTRAEQQLRASNTSLNKTDLESESGAMRYRVEQQRKGSISMVSNQLTTSSGENKVRKFFIQI
jgi:hypothetical protein